jgi:hypothetical protein
MDGVETQMNWTQFKSLILEQLGNELLDKKHRTMKESNPNLDHTFGHCYVASKVAYHLLGGKEEGWTPHYIRHVGRPHWYLKHKSGFILDLTAQQFRTPINYSEGRGKGFLTKEPSKRSKLLIQKICRSNLLNLIKSLGG